MAKRKPKKGAFARFRNYTNQNPWKAWPLTILTVSVSLILLGVLFLSVTVRWGLFGSIPTESELLSIKHDNATIVYSEDEKILGKYFIQNRTSVDFDDIAMEVYDALIATEDARFFQHQGVDLRSWARVLYR
ncbi:MAG: hypothetical protein HKN16_00495, partial [Saprospiraceae bacterium]|nr:hypothetical protein [Saprospiraceae bacterium]